MKSQSHPFKHLRTILRHRRAVFRHCVLAGIPWQGIKHDLSKFSPSEFIPSARHYDGTRSPNELERAEYGCSFAWMHHKGRNKHHFEYWTDYSPITKRMSPVKMPLRYVVERVGSGCASPRRYRLGIGPHYRTFGGRRIYPRGNCLSENGAGCLPADRISQYGR